MSPVDVFTSNGLTPALRLRLADVLAHGYVLAPGLDAWVLCRHDGWAAEYIAGRGWRWGQALRA